MSGNDDLVLRKEYLLRVLKTNLGEKLAVCRRLNARKDILEEKLEKLDGRRERIGEKTNKLREILASNLEDQLRRLRCWSDSCDAAYK